MLKSTRNGATQWLATGAAIVSLAAIGCGGGGGGGSSRRASAAATTSGSVGGSTSSTAGGVTSGSGAGGGVIGGGIPLPGGIGGGGGGIVIPGGGGTPGGGGGTPGGGGTGGGPNPPAGVTDDHGNTMATATAITANNQARGGLIQFAGDQDWFKINLSQGVDYTFFTSGLGAGMDSVLRLLGPTGAQLQENDDESATAVTSRLTIAGTSIAATADYYLVVLHKTPTATTGAYQITAMLGAGGGGGGTPNPNDDHKDDMTTTSALTLGTAMAGNIEVGGDIDWFKVDLQAGTSYEFVTQTLAGGMDSVLSLYDTTGGNLDQNDDFGGALSSRIPGVANTFFPCTATGTYFLEVKHFDSSATGTYEVLARSSASAPPPPADDHKNDSTTTSVLALGTAMAGNLETGGDLDWFKVDLVAGNNYEFKTQTLGTGCDTILSLIDPMGQTADENDDDNSPSATGVASRIPDDGALPSFAITTTGTYFLQVRHYRATGTGTYEVIASQIGGTTPPPPPPPATDDHRNDASTTSVLTLGQAMAGRIEVAGDLDWFKVDLQSGKTYELRTDVANPSSASDDTILTVFDANRRQVARNDDIAYPSQRNSSVSYVATATGTFYVEVKAFGQAVPAYTVTAFDRTTVTPPPPTPTSQASLAAATFADKDGSLDVSAGDEVTLRFSEAVSVIQPAVIPPPTLFADNDFALPVAGDSFGAQASWTISAVNSAEVIVRLGAGAKLRLSGTFDASKVMAGAASGIEVKAGTTIMTASSARGVVTGQKVDVASSLTTGFYDAASLVAPRGVHTATVLDDGRVLVTGGFASVTSAGNPTFSRTNEVYDPMTGVFTEAHDASLGDTRGYMLFPITGTTNQGAPIGRAFHTATKLANGKVLIAGGFGFESGSLNASGQLQVQLSDLRSSFLFDPTTNQFSVTGFLTDGRREHYATLLPNGQVLVSGGYIQALNNGQGGTLPWAELYDPAQGTFTDLSPTGLGLRYPREGGSTEVVNGGVLHIGGEATVVNNSSGTPVRQRLMGLGTETYDPVAKASAVGPALAQDRRWHASKKLANGDIVVVAGEVLSSSGGTTTVAAVKSIEKLVSGGTAFAALGNLQAERARHELVVVGNDLLAIGGVKITRATTTTQTDVATGELIDVATGVSEAFQMKSGRNGHAAVVLASGKVMVIGGWMGAQTYYTGMDGTPVPACEVFVRP